MRFRIEYLTETTKEESVSSYLEVEADDLDGAVALGITHSFIPRRKHNATGFQVKDDGGDILTIEDFGT